MTASGGKRAALVARAVEEATEPVGVPAVAAPPPLRVMPAPVALLLLMLALVGVARGEPKLRETDGHRQGREV